MDASPTFQPSHPYQVDFTPSLGAMYLGDGRCRFRVWALYPKLKLKLFEESRERLLEMERKDRGYYELTLDNIPPGTRYAFRLDDNRDIPDPVSRYQPTGVHQPSAVVDPHFDWTDQGWKGVPLKELITYELHVGTFTSEGTFEAIIPHLAELVDLGITAIELMPVSQFPGTRNWGYDGVHPYAPQNTYGGPDGLKRLVDACHAHGLAVIMDVVYNHLGPEGNYLAQFAPYFTDRYHTPWGAAVNVDGEHSDEVRRFFIENAVYWIQEYHMDGLRLDAVQFIFDFSPFHFLEELTEAVKLVGERENREVNVIAESCINDNRLVRRRELGGYGLDAEWSDDFQYALRTELTGPEAGLYSDYNGFPDLLRAFQNGFAVDGRYSNFRHRRHGSSGKDIPPERLLVYAQNHDQVGNRMLGDRLSESVNFEQQKLAAATVILSPYRPFLFMGEEYGDSARFPYFISHTDERLVNAVRRGRLHEYSRFNWKGSPPDPQDEGTFQSAKLNHHLKGEGEHQVLWEFYRELIRIRKSSPSLAAVPRDQIEVIELGEKVMGIRRTGNGEETFLVLNFSDGSVGVDLPKGNWSKELDSAAERWNGPGESDAVQPSSAVLWRK